MGAFVIYASREVSRDGNAVCAFSQTSIGSIVFARVFGNGFRRCFVNDRNVLRARNVFDWFGSAMFVVGIIGNFYHHCLLASLRTNRSGATTKRYIAPHGGLFDYVAAPHYLFELMGWLGIAIVANHLNAYLTFGSMCSYLAGRAVSQNAWNQKVFTKDEWPSSRKNLIP